MFILCLGGFGAITLRKGGKPCRNQNSPDFLLKYLYKSGYSTTAKGFFGAVASEIILQNWKDRKCLALIATYNANLISEAWNVCGREERRVLWLCEGAQKTRQKNPPRTQRKATADLPSAKSHLVVRGEGVDFPPWHGLPSWVGCQCWRSSRTGPPGTPRCLGSSCPPPHSGCGAGTQQNHPRNLGENWGCTV